MASARSTYEEPKHRISEELTRSLLILNNYKLFKNFPAVASLEGVGGPPPGYAIQGNDTPMKV